MRDVVVLSDHVSSDEKDVNRGECRQNTATGGSDPPAPIAVYVNACKECYSSACIGLL